MTRVSALVLVLAVVLSGCATGAFRTLDRLQEFTAADLRAAAAEGRAARDAGALPTADRWPECFDAVADRLDAAAVRASEPPQGAAVLVMRAHVAKHRAAAPIDASCAQVLVDLERDALQIGAAVVPGGGLLKLGR